MDVNGVRSGSLLNAMCRRPSKSSQQSVDAPIEATSPRLQSPHSSLRVTYDDQRRQTIQLPQKLDEVFISFGWGQVDRECSETRAEVGRTRKGQKRRYTLIARCSQGERREAWRAQMSYNKPHFSGSLVFKSETQRSKREKIDY